MRGFTRSSFSCRLMAMKSRESVVSVSLDIDSAERARAPSLDVPYSLMSEVAFTVLTCPDAHYFPRTQTNALATGLLGVLLLPLIIKTSSMPAPDPASASYKPHLTVVGSEGES